MSNDELTGIWQLPPDKRQSVISGRALGNSERGTFRRGSVAHLVLAVYESCLKPIRKNRQGHQEVVMAKAILK